MPNTKDESSSPQRATPKTDSQRSSFRERLDDKFQNFGTPAPVASITSYVVTFVIVVACVSVMSVVGLFIARLVMQ